MDVVDEMRQVATILHGRAAIAVTRSKIPSRSYGFIYAMLVLGHSTFDSRSYGALTATKYTNLPSTLLAMILIDCFGEILEKTHGDEGPFPASEIHSISPSQRARNALTLPDADTASWMRQILAQGSRGEPNSCDESWRA